MTPETALKADRRRSVLRRDLKCSAVLAMLAMAACATTDSTGRRTSSGTDHANGRPEAPTSVAVSSPHPLFSEPTLRAVETAEVQYRKIVADGGWPQIPKGPPFRPGDGDPRVAVLAQRLAIGGDLGTQNAGRVHADAVAAALRRFQTRHGLDPSGTVDAATSRALNVSADTRLAQLRAARRQLQREHWFPPASRYVVVNIPGFYLEAVDERGPKRHRVIVGRLDRPTPTVNTAIRQVNLLPTWHVPDSIANQDLIPHLQKDPEYLTREGIRVYDSQTALERGAVGIDWRLADASKLKFRQDAGPRNALGLIRLDMPNEHAVYLHDTPLRDLFAQQERALSAGCVRVQGVSGLAEWLLRDTPGWNRERIESVLAGGTPFDAVLAKPVPVRFAYVTAWGGADGLIEFRDDIYQQVAGEGRLAQAPGSPSRKGHAPGSPVAP